MRKLKKKTVLHLRLENWKPVTINIFILRHGSISFNVLSKKTHTVGHKFTILQQHCSTCGCAILFKYVRLIIVLYFSDDLYHYYCGELSNDWREIDICERGGNVGSTHSQCSFRARDAFNDLTATPALDTFGIAITHTHTHTYANLLYNYKLYIYNVRQITYYLNSIKGA